MSDFYFTDDDINTSINNPFYGAQNVDAILEKEEENRLKAVHEQKHNEALQNVGNLKTIKKKCKLSLKKKLPNLDQVISPVPDSSFVIRKNKAKGHHIIKIEILEIDSKDSENSAKTDLSVQYVVSENYDNMMDATENLINRIIQKLSVPEIY